MMPKSLRSARIKGGKIRTIKPYRRIERLCKEKYQRTKGIDGEKRRTFTY
jgi:hypothetical protein